MFEPGAARQFDRLFRYRKEYLEMVEAVIAPMRREVRMDGAHAKVLARLGGGEMPLRLLSRYGDWLGQRAHSTLSSNSRGVESDERKDGESKPIPPPFVLLGKSFHLLLFWRC